MASPERVQGYLQKHKVGVLFEDLMAKVINDMPDDPLVYLSRILQLRVDRKDARSLKKSGDFDGDTKKNYDKPWSTNSKRLRPKELDPKTGKKTTKPEWNYKTKTVSSSFEDIWDDRKTKSPTKGTTSGHRGWEDSSPENGEDVMYEMYGYRGPHKTRRDMNDPLAGEMTLSKEKKYKSVAKKTQISSRRSGRGVDSARNKTALQQYIKEHAQKSDSGIEEDRDLDSDDAIELMEDLDDLRREGVRNVKQSGVRIINTCRQPATPIRVSICARCAHVMGGGEPSQPAGGAKFAELTDYDYDTEKAVSTSRVQTARTYPGQSEDDEEFESVSQVTGPRRPVWQDSDNEAVTPRKGKNMLKSNMSPSKGLPMYSSDKPQMSSRGHKKGATSPAKSAQFYEHRGHGLDDSPVRMTWSPAMDGGEYSEGKPQTARTVTIAADKDDDFISQSARSEGTGWQVPPDYDAESSFYGSPGAKPPRRTDRG